jgi:hypothetical protein
MGEKTGNTNLASEFYVLSMLYRLGVDAYLTLGNKKSVDIVVVKKDGKQVTVDVKGLRDKSCFIVNNMPVSKENHYIIFISFLNKMADPKSLPEVYVVPVENLRLPESALDGEALIKTKSNISDVTLSRLRCLGEKYLDKWEYVV